VSSLPQPSAGPQQQDDELEAIVELPRLDEDAAKLVTTAAFGSAPYFSFHDVGTTTPPDV
jgi:EREBP-like factor